MKSQKIFIKELRDLLSPNFTFQILRNIWNFSISWRSGLNGWNDYGNYGLNFLVATPLQSSPRIIIKCCIYMISEDY